MNLRGHHEAPLYFKVHCLEHCTNYQSVANKLKVRPNELLDSIRKDNTPGQVKLNNSAFEILREYEFALYDREPIKQPKRTAKKKK